MTLTSPPSIVTLLDTQLQACASFPSGATTWYPAAPAATSGTLFVLSASDINRTKFAVGAQGIPTGTLEIVLYADLAIGVIESLAQALLDELLTADAPLTLRGGSVGLCIEPDPGEIAGGRTRRAIAISLEHGLSV